MGKQKGEWAGRPKNPSPSPPSKEEEEEEDALSLPGKNGREEEEEKALSRGIRKKGERFLRSGAVKILTFSAYSKYF